MFKLTEIKQAVLTTLCGMTMGYATAATAAETTAAETSADTADAEQVKRLDKVIVTAQYRPQNIQDIPAAITAINTRDLSSKGSTFIGDVLTYTPNAAAQNPDGDGRPRWYIRGLGTGDVAASTVYPVGIYADGVYLNAPVAGAGDLFDLERIEVLRGPQGTLYGKNTTAGAVNYISRKPTFTEKPTGYATIGLGNYNLQSFETAINGQISERLAIRAAFYSEARDGFDDNLSTGESYGDLDKKSFRLQALWNINDNWETLLKLHSQSYDGSGYNGSLSVGSYWGIYSRPEGRDTNLNLDESEKGDHDGISLTLNAKVGAGLTLTSISAFDKISKTAITDSDYTVYDVSRSYSDNEWLQYSQEFRLASDAVQHLSWIAGIHLFYEELDAKSITARPNQQLPNGNAAQTTSSPAFRDISYLQDNQSFAVFGNATYKFTDKFKVTGGLRWTWDEKEIDLDLLQITTASYSHGSWWSENSYTDKVYNSNAGANGSSNNKKSWSDLTYDLTPEYDINSDLKAYFRYAHGFRAGGFNTGLTGNISHLTVVEPEYLDSYELGLKAQLLDGNLIANATLFFYDYEDIQTNLLVNIAGEGGGVTSVLTNGPEAEVKGAELELDYLATENLRLRLAAAYLDSEYTRFVDVNPNTNSVNADNTGNSLVRSPKYTLGIGGDYSFYLQNGARLVFGTDASYRDREYFLVNRQDYNVDPTLSQKSYTLWNANLGYYAAHNKYQINAYIKNVLNKDYQVHGRPNGTAGQYVLTYGNPRQFGLSFTARY